MICTSMQLNEGFHFSISIPKCEVMIKVFSEM